MEENQAENISLPAQDPEPATARDNVFSGNWWKIGFLVVGLLLAGSIFYAGYQFSKKQTIPVATYPTPSPISSPVVQVSPSPTTDETANWKTYTDNGGKFSIKYPINKKVDIKTKDAYIGFCNLGPSIVAIDLYNQDQIIPDKITATEFTGYLSITITMQAMQYDLTIDKWLNDNCKGSWVLDPTTKKSTILINSIQATKYTGGQMGIGSLVVYPTKNDEVYMFYGWPVGDKEKTMVFNQILSTFRFD